MNARDGMRRLRAERIAYGLCVRCGARLESGYALRTCPECRMKVSEADKKRRREKRARSECDAMPNLRWCDKDHRQPQGTRLREPAARVHRVQISFLDD